MMNPNYKLWAGKKGENVRTRRMRWLLRKHPKVGLQRVAEMSER